MKVEQDAILTCANCGMEGPHELLYLSEHMRGSRCQNCRYAAIYSDHLYADYAWDLMERTTHLPQSLASRAFRRPTAVFSWPLKAARKPFGLVKEFGYVTVLERGVRSRKR
ncbi:hypothetical protein BH23ACT11_BH23ACT11_00120 [soil metagenome]